MYGLSQAGILANELLQKNLMNHGYAPCKHTPGLWTHKTKPTQFVLVVDDFGVKYVGRENFLHLITVIKGRYPKVIINLARQTILWYYITVELLQKNRGPFHARILS